MSCQNANFTVTQQVVITITCGATKTTLGFQLPKPEQYLLSGGIAEARPLTLCIVLPYGIEKKRKRDTVKN